MAGLNTFLAVIVILTSKDEVFSCPTRSHKVASSLSDSTSSQHHSSATTISCNSASGLSSGSSSISPSLPNTLTLPPKPTFTPDKLLPSFLPPTSNVDSSNYLDLLNILNKILSSSSSNAASSLPQILPTTHSTLPNLPVSNIVRGPAKILKPHTIHSSHASLSSSGPCSSGILSTPSNGEVPSLIVTPSPSQEFSFQAPVLNATSFNISGDNQEHLNILQKPTSDVQSPTNLPSNTPKLIPLSQLCTQFMPALNKSSSAVPDLILQNKLYSNAPSDANGSLSNLIPGILCNPSSNTMLKVPEAVSESALKEFLTPISAPILKPEPILVPTTVLTPASTLTANKSVVYGRNPVIMNLSHKHSLSTKAPKIPHVPSLIPGLSPPCVKTTLNTASIHDWGIKPHTHNTSLGCVTPPGSIGSSLLPKPAFIKAPTIPLPSPTLNKGISFGYNPAFMQLLVNRLISNPNSPLPSLASLVHQPYLQASLNTTPVSPTPQSIFQSISLNKPPCDLNTNIFNVSTDKLQESTLAPGSTSTATSNTSLCNNPAFTSILCKLLLSSLTTSKTNLSPCLPP